MFKTTVCILKLKLLLVVLIFSQVLKSQNSSQIWLEYKPSYSFEKNYKLGMRTSFIEFFYQTDEDIQERYANRYWIRLGLGYKLNKNLTFELLYNRQDTKNTITTSYDDLEIVNIFVCSLKHN